ncbi:MAG: hypothetical protein CSA61_00375 [Neptuniibacter caesariensis]|uniref:Uncharacterized protein n=1 Tax=Neptuniibacter caesariensis TaxID=207954 RepID=A0A2G6JB42_NEPCE|nr:MAG: hypothetical protein CSA61_00375 [Neptuniibacter caesariensis]
MFSLKVKDVTHQLGQNEQTLTASLNSWKRSKKVWFKTGPGPINQTIEPFLPVALIPAMRRNWNVRLAGAVSPSLLAGTDHIQQTIAAWYPSFRTVKIRAKQLDRAADTASRPVAAFFSGGVDSFYTLKKHADQITHLVFVHGFDVVLSDKAKRREFADNARSIADKQGLQLVEVETNLREFGDRYVSWLDAYCGAGLASIALLLSPRFETIYLPSSVSSEQLMPMGTHPDLDRYWGNGQINIVHDGLESGRFEKIEDIADWDLVSQHLRVCFQKDIDGLNCGRCRKCTWTMMVFEALGKLADIRTLPDQVDCTLIKEYPAQTISELDRITKSFQYLQASGRNKKLLDVLEKMVADGRQRIKARQEVGNVAPKGGLISRILRRYR